MVLDEAEEELKAQKEVDDPNIELSLSGKINKLEKIIVKERSRQKNLLFLFTPPQTFQDV